MTENQIGTHATHCCKECGCKYGNPECPVVLGTVEAQYDCGECAECLSRLLEEIRHLAPSRRATVLNALNEPAAFCAKCEFCKIIADPDPDDSFNGDDRAVVCTKVRNPDVKPDSEWVAARNPHRVVEGSVRPYQVGAVPTPDWCPLRG